MPLSDTTIRTAKPTEKPYKLADEKGLFLLVSPNGSKWWRLKFRVDGKEKLLSLGVYPEISLKKARADRDTARSMLAEGIDPSHQRKATKAARVELSANSFEIICREWPNHVQAFNPSELLTEQEAAAALQKARK